MTSPSRLGRSRLIGCSVALSSVLTASASALRTDFVTAAPDPGVGNVVTRMPPEGTDDQSIMYVFFARSHRAVIQNRTEAAIATCLSQQGFEYPLDERAVEGHDWVAELTGRLGPFDVAQAQQSGYANPHLEDDPVPDEPSGDAAFQVALTGTADAQVEDLIDPVSGEVIGRLEVRGGCLGEADVAVFGGADRRARYYALDIGLQNLAVEILLGAETSAAVLDAQDAWSQCMQARGYDYLTTSDPLDIDWPDPASEVEIATAVADVECKSEVGLVERFLEEVGRAEASREAEFSTLLAEWFEITDEITSVVVDS